MAVLQQRDFEVRIERTEKVIAALESIADEDAKRSALEAVQALLDLHGDGLARVLEVLEARGDAGGEMIQALARDQVVGGLLLLHGIHPRSLDARVAEALEKVRPYLGSHGGNVELLGTAGGVVSLRLEGSCHGCPSSTMTLKHAIEQEIMDIAPDVVAIEVEGLVEPPRPPAGFIPLSQVRPMAATTAPAKPWQTIEGLPVLASGQLHRTEIAGGGVLLLRIEENLYAYRARCPGCGAADFSLTGEALACAGCGHRFDARHAGRSLQNAELHLEPLPLLADAREVRIAAGA